MFLTLTHSRTHRGRHARTDGGREGGREEREERDWETMRVGGVGGERGSERKGGFGMHGLGIKSQPTDNGWGTVENQHVLF